MGEEPGDAGVTLLELLVAMVIMSIFGSMFVSAIVQMYGAANRTETSTIIQSQLTVTFQRLDAEIRYASGFSTPGSVAGTGWYVEYLVTNTSTESCGELWLESATGRLKWRRWTHGSTPPSNNWTVLASGVTSPSPFTVVLPATGSRDQTLALSLTVNQNGRSKQLQTTFDALNSSRSLNTSTSCVEGRSVP